MRACNLFRPDMLVILGDFIDCYSVSDHSKDPNRARLLDREVAATNVLLDQLDALRIKERIYVSGNHEDRLERYLMNKAPELFNMVRVEELLRLKSRGWKYVPYKQDVQIGKLYITHDTDAAGSNAHQKSMDAYQTNVVIGHTHRIGYAIEGNAQGKPHVGAMFGWLGDFNSVDYMKRIKARRYWSHGAGIGYMEPNGTVHLRPIPFINNSCVIEGVLVTL